MELTDLQQAEQLANDEHVAASRAYYTLERENKEARARFMEAAEIEFEGRPSTVANVAEQERLGQLLTDTWNKRQAAVKALHAHASLASGLIGKRVEDRVGGHLSNSGVIEIFDKGEGLYPQNQKYGLPYDGALCIRVLKANGQRSTKVVELRQANELPGLWKYVEDVDKTQQS